MAGLIIALAVALTACGGISRSDAKAMRAELDGWQLPPTVELSTRRDVVAGSVTRYFDPAPGVSLNDAFRDLVRALRQQGYEDLRDGYANCDAIGACHMEITRTRGGRIKVWMYYRNDFGP